MSYNNYKPLTTGYARVFIIEGRARPDHVPQYFSSLKMGGISQSFGDVTKIEIPNPDRYGEYLEIDRIRGAVERATFNLSGRFAAAMKSKLLNYARKGCPVDVQLHIGECTDPSAFNVFTKAVISEDSIVTNHSTDDLGALESGENAIVNETADISATEYYEVLPMTFSTRAGDIVTNPVVDVIVYDYESCGTCSIESDGCMKIYAVTRSAGGSPGTPPDILFSLDGGATWRAHDIDTLATSKNASSVAGLGDYVVVASSDDCSLNYCTTQDLADLVDPYFTKVTTGIVTGKCPNHIWSLGRKAFIAANGGYVYTCTDPTYGVTAVETGAATTANLKFVHAISEERAVAVGDGGAVIRTNDGLSWENTMTRPVGAAVTLNCVWMKTETEWWVASNAGKLYYTLNSGKTWVEKTMPGTTPSRMNRIAFSTPSVGYAAGIVSSRARLYRTFDGGYSWVVLPESGAAFQLADEFLAIAACKYNPNMVVCAGIHDDATDGVIVTGNAS
jgi:hypothetical protein